MLVTVGIVLVSESRYSSPPTAGSLPRVVERLAKGHLVDRLVPPEELGHRFEDLGVGLAVEVVERENLEHDVDRVVLEENTSEHGTLRLERIRWDVPDSDPTSEMFPAPSERWF